MRKSLLLICILFFGKINFAQTQKLNSVTSTTYAVNSIPYAPYSFTTGTSVLVNQDDLYSPTINLGFTFNYFGMNFTQCVLGSNGIITFDLTKSGGINNWPISSALPNMVDMTGNTICAAFRDIDPTSSGNTFYSTFGVSPNRYFVVSWDSVPMFDNPGPCGTIPNSTFQAVLRETSNNIEVYIQNSSACTAWNGGYGIIGIQDSAATTGYSPPGRNFPTAWTAVNEGWCFSPTGSCPTSTSIKEISNKNGIYLFPNPSAGILNVQSDQNFTSEAKIEITNAIGQVILILPYSNSIDISSLENGFYTLKIESNDKEIYRSKFVKE